MRIHHPKIMISLLAMAFISIGSSKAHKAPERNQLFDSNWKFCLGAQPQASFDGVCRNAEVYINVKSLGMHPYGYTAFNLDLTPYLNFSEANTKGFFCQWYSFGCRINKTNPLSDSIIP